MVVGFAIIYFVVIMTVVLRAQSGPDPTSTGRDLVGHIGTVRSVLNPEGHVFVAGVLWRARWVGEDIGRIRTGTAVRVRGIDGSLLLVDAVEPETLVASEMIPPANGNQSS